MSGRRAGPGSAGAAAVGIRGAVKVRSPAACRRRGVRVGGWLALRCVLTYPVGVLLLERGADEISRLPGVRVLAVVSVLSPPKP